MRDPLYVTRPMLPDRNDLKAMIDDIWASGVVTNGGPVHGLLEENMANYLGVPTAMLFGNGTIGLLAALKLLHLPPGSEVITSPLTFAATAHSIHWNGLRAVFADVSPETLTLDPRSVECAITSNTSAILGIHVYGTACDVDALQEIANAHELKLVYDAAHAFGTEIKGRPIAMFGDASVFSFHATKLFTTLEGGLVATPKPEDQQRLYYLRNFGILNEEEVVDIGINGKMNEVQAAVGLLNLPHVDEERSKRRKLRAFYDEQLSALPGLRTQVRQEGVTCSEQYYPLVIEESLFGCSRDDIYEKLKSRNIFARKYFHPICTDFAPYRGFPIISAQDRPYVETVKSQVLCLPFFGAISEVDAEEICSIIVGMCKGNRAIRAI
ncbi:MULTISPECIES: DegT/DnrJ/EryC1/StrS family aminotransferase [unclassified Ruegeria]|uniref:aminotransferase class I/II-fold pyridoxal phosphate-dependent enzyme n=2 Tax=unclassified Ruegeria TaxID=2625375 RepID=UPI0014880274|nr:aminotransferase class I/II-fold pyridoxal phosphate-dependent enzyme [Ruegeria sp. HKCCD7296]NOE34255.1 aminotransferase class I/II-fold pyridoxal phosphate-dependent enzyme [Ruegeria sp. HKCCD7318]NOE40346.1 aminotransferase class I/II-fold pyridoxal phosphate-dependent enzyme [Ruegeria sp. HKCCD7319]